MSLVLNEEQRLLKQTAAEFLDSHAPVAQLRELRDSKDAVGYSEALWQQMAELGWASIILPEEYGGLDFGFLGLGAVIEETGRRLTASPLLATSVIGASAVLLGGSSEQKQSLLPAAAAGEITLALALEETPHHNPAGVAMRAQAVADGYQLTGEKLFVIDGHSADTIITVARTSGDPGSTEGLSLFLVDGHSAGLSRKRTIMADSRNAANLGFDSVVVPNSALLGEVDQGWQVLEPVLDRARVSLAAEMLGSAWEVFERTNEYLKEREQFGVKIGTFQALQHRAALLFAELQMAQSVVMQALSTVDDNPDQLPQIASLAKARLNDLIKLVTNEGVQMHGGIGVTDDLEIGFFLKRARVAMQLFGDAGYHKDRYATLNGY